MLHAQIVRFHITRVTVDTGGKYLILKMNVFRYCYYSNQLFNSVKTVIPCVPEFQ